MGSGLDELLSKKWKETNSKTDRLLWERIWTNGVINKILFLTEIEFIVARNVARGFIPAKYSETMVSLQGGDCHPTRRRGTRLGQKRTVSVKYEHKRLYSGSKFKVSRFKVNWWKLHGFEISRGGTLRVIAAVHRFINYVKQYEKCYPAARRCRLQCGEAKQPWTVNLTTWVTFRLW